MPPKKLFDDTTDHFSINEKYAADYDKVKRTKELQHLVSKYEKDGKGRHVGFDERSSSSSDDTSSVSSTGEFSRVMQQLKHHQRPLPTEDAELPENQEQTEGEKKKARATRTLRDEYHRSLVTEAAGQDQEDEKKKTKIQDTRSRREFLSAAAATSNDAANFSLVKRASKDAEEEVTLEKPIKKRERRAEKEKFWEEHSDDDEDTKFLNKFFKTEAWKNAPADGSKLNPLLAAADDDDEEFFDSAEKWELEYQNKQQFRHEEGPEAEQVQTFPRGPQEGELRARDTRRADARKAKKEKRTEETSKADAELRRLKKLKRKEIEEQVEKICAMSGLNSNAMDKRAVAQLWSSDTLEKDFDPEEFDRLMNSMFGEEYYNDIDEKEEQILEAELDESQEIVARPDQEIVAQPDNDLFDTKDEFQEEILYPMAAETKQKKGSKVSTAELGQQLKSKVKDYWQLHYEDNLLGGELKTRFKYRTVNPEGFGFTPEEILTSDDRMLNTVAPINCYAPYVPPEQNVRDRYRCLHRKKNLRLLPSDRTSRRYKTDTVVLDSNLDGDEGEGLAAKIIPKLKKLAGDEVEPGEANSRRKQKSKQK